LLADPCCVPLAQVVPEVSFNEVMELAYFGAKVISPKTMQPAIVARIPIYICNTFSPQLPRSCIFTSSSMHGQNMACAFLSIEHVALINVKGSGLVGVLGVAKRLFGTLEQGGINVILISQASSEHSITFATLNRQAEAAKEMIETEFY
jgi:bifunctional aspartokinase / homoserine dehydrogenase 1